MEELKKSTRSSNVYHRLVDRNNSHVELMSTGNKKYMEHGILTKEVRDAVDTMCTETAALSDADFEAVISGNQSGLEDVRMLLDDWETRKDKDFLMLRCIQHALHPQVVAQRDNDALWLIRRLAEVGVSMEPMKDRVLASMIDNEKVNEIQDDSIFSYFPSDPSSNSRSHCHLRMKKTIHTAFDLGIRKYRGENIKLGLEFLHFLCLHSSSEWILLQTENLVFQDDCLKPEEFESLCHTLIKSSKHPIHKALIVSNICLQLSKFCNRLRREYANMSLRFSSMAVSMIDEIDTDALVLIFLESLDIHGKSVFEYALEYKISGFLESPRISNVVDLIWSQPRCVFLGQNSRKSFSELLLTSRKELYYLPLGKFSIDFVSFSVYISYFTITSIGVAEFSFEAFRSLVFGLGILSFAYFIGEVARACRDQSYFNCLYNLAIFTSYFVSFSCVFAGQILNPFVESTDSSGNRRSSSFNISTTLTILVILLSFPPLLLFFRMLEFFKVDPNRGPLLIALQNSISDLVNILFYFLAIIFSFALGFYILQGESSWRAASQTTNFLITSSFGEFDFDFFDRIDSSTIRAYSICAYLLFLIVVLIALINLLIAAITKTFEDVRREASQQFLYQKAKVTLKYDSLQWFLPSPFCILAWVLFIPIWVYENVFNRASQSEEDVVVEWICTKCGTLNSEGDRARSRSILLRMLDRLKRTDLNRDNATMIKLAKEQLYPTEESCRALCKFCLRHNKVTYSMWEQNRAYRKSFEVVYSLIVYPLLCFVFSGPFIARILLSNFFRTRNSRKQKLLALRNVTNTKQTEFEPWVTRNIHSKPLVLEDFANLLN